MLTQKQKIYQAVLLLGRETDTQDVWGKTIREQSIEGGGINEDMVRQAVMGFVGAYDQIPPMYSALKVNGKKLYELARAGKTVERQPRQVFIYNIEIQSIELPKAYMTVCCSKGTYIRTLCHDIGARLGCGGCMEGLVRTQVERFKLEDSLTLAEIEALRDQGTLMEHIVSIEAMFSHYLSAATEQKWDHLSQNGNPLKAEQVRLWQDAEGPEGEKKETEDFAHKGSIKEFYSENVEDGTCFRIYDSRGKFMGIYLWEKEKAQLRPFKMFFDNC